MPQQSFRHGAIPGSGPNPRRQGMRVWLARLIAFGGALAIAAVGAWQMSLVFGDQMTPLQMILLGLFTLTFGWVGFSFTSVLSGLIAPRLSTPDGANAARLAVVMPVYHENPAETSGLLAALAQEVSDAGLADRAEIFVLSDSRRPEAWLAEMAAITRLRALSPIPVWYRRRDTNEGRKAGNVAEFVRRWGGRYDQMVVLDADSIVGGQTIAAMSARMNADPALGLIQTMPMLVGGQTIFARLIQFAGRIYGAAVARGVSAWSGDDGNYWGHNAMIRMQAFAACCGLPDLPGRAPFGGTILSHDFVEAALMRRAGWKVRLDHDLRASFEGSPPTLLDMAVRERRWAQGNLQHARLLLARGLSPISRVHFLIGILGFVMSPLWLAMILVGLALAAHVLLARPEYFPQTYQLFPSWPVFDPTRMLWLFVAAMVFLLTPKLIAVIAATLRPQLRQGAGGAFRILRSVLFEILLSTLIAPVQMLIQTRQIFDILRGRDSGWEAQVRAGAMPGWRVVLGHHAGHVLLGVGTLVVLGIFSPGQLIWLSPILAGLILSPLTSRWSASPVIGRWARRRGLLLTPEERQTPPIMAAANQLAFQIGQRLPDLAALGADPRVLDAHIAMLPEPRPRSITERLPEISARAKIEASENRAQALSFLTAEEKTALLGQPDLLRYWAALSA